MKFKVRINGNLVSVHAKNEGQLVYAVAAFKGALSPSDNDIEEVQHGTPDDEQDGTVNSASIGRPYPY